MKKQKPSNASLIRGYVNNLEDEKEQYRKKSNKLRWAGKTLIKYLIVLGKGGTAGLILKSEVKQAIEIIENDPNRI